MAGLLSAMLGTLVALLSPPVVAAQEIGVLKTVEGDVVIRREEAELRAIVGRSLLLNDRIVTPVGGSVGAILNDGTVLSVSGMSDVQVSNFVFRPGEGLFALVVRLLSGRLVYDSGKIGAARPDRVRVETPQLVIGSRGTRFAVIVPADAP
ncbi:MAG: FecR domain-containing protein [Pseudomonadota bacterium]